MQTISARILADSISLHNIRLTTLEVSMPRIILAEFNTHRMFSRNSASSRAIPVNKILQRVEENPFIPVYWGKNQKGMQAEEELSEREKQAAKELWLESRDYAIQHTRALLQLGVHKQISNRLLEPFMYHTVIVTATEFSNFFHLRENKDAQPEIQYVARAMHEAMDSSIPVPKKLGEWHLPLIFPADYEDIKLLVSRADDKHLACISSARCARISYLTHDTGKRDIYADLSLYDRLTTSGHMSPLEHPAMVAEQPMFFDNLRGWKSLRYQMPHQADMLAVSP